MAEITGAPADAALLDQADAALRSRSTCLSQSGGTHQRWTRYTIAEDAFSELLSAVKEPEAEVRKTTAESPEESAKGGVLQGD